MVLLGKALTAFLAHVRSFAGVELAVRYQVTLQGKGTSALLADEWALAAVNARVSQQVVLEGEALLALLALIRPLRRVQQQMCVKAVLVREALAAMAADMGAFTCDSQNENNWIRPAPSGRLIGQEQEQPPVCTRAWVVK